MHTTPEARGLPLPYHSPNHQHSEDSLGSIEGGSGTHSGESGIQSGGSGSQSGESGSHSADKLFACPYAKRASRGDTERQSCSESGWTTIRRLRQHIYRCHVLPIKCPSCSQAFESRTTFTCHVHTVTQYDRSHCEAEEPIQGLENLIKKIRTPRPSSKDASEEDMWKVIYTTLFPNDPRDEIPSPYFEPPTVVFSSESELSIDENGSMHVLATPLSHHSGNCQRRNHDPTTISPGSTPPISPLSEHFPFSPFERSDEETCSCRSPGSVYPTPNVPQPDGGPFEGPVADSIGEENVNMPQAPEPAHVRTPQREPSKRRKLGKKLREKTLEAQVAAFKAWKTPHRTDEHITPGVYSRFWKGLARCFTFYIPSWFLKSFFKMHDLRRRLAFRQKVLFCLVLAVVYGLVSYFLVIQPLLSCVIKVHIGMIPKDSSFCRVVSYVIYVYMGLGGAFMLLVAFCVGRVRYTSRAFEEHNAMLVMHIPCYNENEPVLRKTIDSCVESSYEKNRKLLFIVTDGNMAAEGEEKPSHRILLEDIFHHTADPELGIDDQAQSYSSFDSNGESENLAFCYTGFYRDVPYVVVAKVGREDEKDNPKPGNRGKRDSQLVVYNFFHYVNYRRLWSPLFENLEFKMRTCLNMDASNATYMLVVDCDTEVQKTGISYLINQLQKDPKLIGACGYTGVNNPTGSFVASSQVFEYWLTHAVLKAVETMCTNVLVLSGCFTIYRLKWPNNQPAILHPLLLEDYAGIYEKTLHEHNLLTIGEDRYLSTLAIRYFGSDCRLRYFSAATCTTTVPDNLTVLLDQRRRWTNSLIHCHFAHLNVLPFEASFWTHVRLLFIIGAELFMVFILPLALPAGLVLAIISVLLTDYAWAILIAFLLLPVLICVLCNDWRYIPYYLPFFPMIAVFSIIIPLFSVWKQDNVKWGKTRGG